MPGTGTTGLGYETSSAWSSWVPNLSPILEPSREKPTFKHLIARMFVFDMAVHLGMQPRSAPSASRRQTAALLAFWSALTWGASNAERWAVGAAARDRELVARVRCRLAEGQILNANLAGRESTWVRIYGSLFAGLGMLRVFVGIRPALRHEMGAHVGGAISNVMVVVASACVALPVYNWRKFLYMNAKVEDHFFPEIKDWD